MHDILGKPYSVEESNAIITMWELEQKVCESIDLENSEIIELFLTMITYREKTIADFIQSEDGIKLLGQNKFDTVVWFNKELAEKVLELGIILHVIFKAKKSDFKSIEKAWNLATTAIEDSEYKIENLLEILERI